MSLRQSVLTGPGARRDQIRLASQPARAIDATSGALLVNVWVVSDGSQTEFVEAIAGLYEYLGSTEGFIGGALLAGVNPTRFISYAQLRSSRDRQRLVEDDEVSARLRAISRIARADLHSYTVLREFGPLVPEPATGL